MKEKIGLLSFLPISGNEHLVSDSVLHAAQKIGEGKMPLVAEIDPKCMGGKELCEQYEIDPEDGANCVIVEVAGSSAWEFAAIVTPVGYRADLNNTVRKHLNAKRISLAQLDITLKMTGMEYGSITPFGLPEAWKILIDARLRDKERVIVGGGRQLSKLLLRVDALKDLSNAEFIEGPSSPIPLL